MTTAARYIARATELAGAATEGPWTVEDTGSHGRKSWSIEGAIRWREYTHSLHLDEDLATAEFIAFARDFVPKAAAALAAVLALADDYALIEADDLTTAIESALGGAE